MRYIKRILLAILIILNVIMIAATFIVYKQDREMIYIVFCITICITSIVSMLPLFLKKDS
ncbi:hypothetical protein SAMN06265379_103232 [Saccharicrinis carchari]|uniref:Uncharacterized protein n=1 Tax=Saccharicrinis carchari TaxID=1168039 RepID=A0A521CKH6_SACCC|nr:hypothetical protein SAMN06265379_103232 [Saccharicrinis carchari]